MERLKRNVLLISGGQYISMCYVDTPYLNIAVR
jgi:hypothetical protein